MHSLLAHVQSADGVNAYETSVGYIMTKNMA